MASSSTSCVLLADRHHRMIECVRDMLENEFAALFIVANEESLLEGATRLQPAIVIVDTSLVPGRLPELLQRLRACSPQTKALLLSVYDQSSVARFGLEAQADGVVLKRAIATDLLEAVDAVLADRSYVSPGMELPEKGDAID